MNLQEKKPNSLFYHLKKRESDNLYVIVSKEYQKLIQQLDMILYPIIPVLLSNQIDLLK